MFAIFSTFLDGPKGVTGLTQLNIYSLYLS